MISTLWNSYDKYKCAMIPFFFSGNPGEMEWTLPKIGILRYLRDNFRLDQIRGTMEYRINQWQKHSSHLFLMVSWWQNGTHMLSGWICLGWICGWPKVLVHFDTTRCQWYYQWSLDSWWSTCLFGYNSGKRSFKNTKLSKGVFTYSILESIVTKNGTKMKPCHLNKVLVEACYIGLL